MFPESMTEKSPQRKFYGKIAELRQKEEFRLIPKSCVDGMVNLLRSIHFVADITIYHNNNITITAAIIIMELLLVFKTEQYEKHIYSTVVIRISRLIGFYKRYRDIMKIRDVVALYAKCCNSQILTKKYISSERIVTEVVERMEKDVKSDIMWILWSDYDPKKYKHGYGNLTTWLPKEVVEDVLQLHDNHQRHLHSICDMYTNAIVNVTGTFNLTPS